MTDRRQILVELDKFASREAGKLQLRVLQAITFANPVDTGFSRGAWTPSVGTPDTTVHVVPRDEAKAKSQGASNRSKNLDRSKGIVRSYRLKNGTIFISNNLPYIGRLNAGSSAQAPARFVEAAILTAVRSR